MSAIVNIGARGAQIIFAAVVLGLSVNLAKGQQVGSAPAPLGYAAFVGAFSMLGALLGLAATWVEVLGGLVGAVVDGLLIILNLAGGILLAVKIKGVDCSSQSLDNQLKLASKDILTEGCEDIFKGCERELSLDDVLSRCKQVEADSAFLFLTLLVVAAALTVGLLHKRK